MEAKTYDELLQSKIKLSTPKGFDITKKETHQTSFEHQKDMTMWALKKGRALIGASFGLGKTHVQADIMRIVVKKYPQALTLVVCPLGVKYMFEEEDGPRLGMKFKYVRTTAEVLESKTPFMVTNYERVRDGGIDTSLFTAVSLDEGSVLRSLGSQTCQQFIELFKYTQFKFVATATPAPNEYNELLNYAHFLGVMDRGQALTRWFQRDSEKAGNLQLHPHMEKEFWMWVSSWALFLTAPSDLGYSDEGYDLPELDVQWHMVSANPLEKIKTDRDGQTAIFSSAAASLPDAAREKKTTIDLRVAKAKEIIDEQEKGQHWLLWHHLENERKAIENAFMNDEYGAFTVFGSQPLVEREELIMSFGKGEYPILGTKPEIAGSGCNFQKFCHSNIFLGITYQFEEFIQAIHRTHRFQQKERVQVRIIYTDSEVAIRSTLEAKWQAHNELQVKMREIIKEFGLSHEKAIGEMKRAIGVERKEYQSANATIIHNDCVAEMPRMQDNSVHMICTSIPFGNHYEYSANYADFGHNEDNPAFFDQMDFLTPELLRVLKPGRVAAIHVKDRIQYGKVTGTGMPTVEPFHAHCIMHYMKHGFQYMGMVFIETDVVRENNQTYRLGWSEQCKDGSKMGIGSPEFLLIFRKLPTDLSTAYADEPVSKTKDEYSRGRWQIDARAKWNSSGNRLLTPDELANLPVDMICRMYNERMMEHVYNFEEHVAIAHAMEEKNKLPSSFETLQVPARSDMVWTDVNRMNTLNSKQTQRRERNHICPLQIDIVDRVIERWSNPGDVILDPFGGLMTVPIRGIAKGRRGIGIELNPEYFRCGVMYTKEAELKCNVPQLFDMEEVA